MPTRPTLITAVAMSAVATFLISASPVATASERLAGAGTTGNGSAPSLQPGATAPQAGSGQAAPDAAPSTSDGAPGEAARDPEPYPSFRGPGCPYHEGELGPIV